MEIEPVMTRKLPRGTVRQRYAAHARGIAMPARRHW